MKRKILFLIPFLLFAYLVKSQQFSINGQDLRYAVSDGKVDSVWDGINLPSGFSGKDVIIGFTDWGFDVTHPVFYDTSMVEYRVLRMWDQSKLGGPAPAGFGYGTEFVGKNALLAAHSDTANVYSYHYHGTHVASIAGGAGAGTPYRGVAFGANLIFVSILVNENAILDAFRWMYKVSIEEQKRLVVNMSWGLYYIDNMDGTGKMKILVDSLTNLGVVFVSSAGNNGDVNFHISQDFSTNIDTLKTVIGYASGSNVQYGESVSMINSENSSFSFAVQLMNTNNICLARTLFYNTLNGNLEIDTFLVVNNTDTLFYTAAIELSNSYNSRPQARLIIKKITGYRVGLIIFAPSGEFHAWNLIELTNGVGNWGGTFSSMTQAGWSNGDARFGIGAPANIDAIITIAAHRTKRLLPSGIYNGGAIASFSSWGPTIDYRIKPEISAPGYNIVAAISSFSDIFTGSATLTIPFEGRNYKFAPLSGTSMSSPFAAGVVALLLQANPYLSPQQIKQILIETAYQDTFTEQSGEERFGFGKIDAYHAITKVLGITGINKYNIDNVRFTCYPNPATDKLYFILQADSKSFTLYIYDMYGRTVGTYNVLSGVNCVEINSLSKGYYILKLTDGKTVKTGKIVKM